MRDPEMFKYDVRVRERMVKAGRLSSDELSKQLAALPDVEENAVSIELEQPALGRADGSGTSRTSAPPPPVVAAIVEPEVEGVQGLVP